MADTISMKPAAQDPTAASTAAKSETVGYSKNTGMQMQPPYNMPSIPTLPGAHPSTPQAHKFNTLEHAKRFGTDNEKKMMNSAANAAYPGEDGSCCPSY